MNFIAASIAKLYLMSLPDTLRPMRHMEDRCITNTTDAHIAPGNLLKSNLMRRKKMPKIDVPIWEKTTLTIEEASAYSNIGVNKLRDMANSKECSFVLFVGSKHLIKRKAFERFLEESYSI